MHHAQVGVRERVYVSSIVVHDPAYAPSGWLDGTCNIYRVSQLVVESNLDCGNLHRGLWLLGVDIIHLSRSVVEACSKTDTV